MTPERPLEWRQQNQPGRKTRLGYFQTELAIAMPDWGNRNLQYLLGRDIIDRCRMLHDKMERKLQFTPRLADGTMNI